MIILDKAVPRTCGECPLKSVERGSFGRMTTICVFDSQYVDPMKKRQSECPIKSGDELAKEITAKIEEMARTINNPDTVNGLIGALVIVDDCIRDDETAQTNEDKFSYEDTHANIGDGVWVRKETLDRWHKEKNNE